MKDKVKVGTRGSLLAKTQTALVQQALRALGLFSEIIEIETTGDRKQDVTISIDRDKKEWVKEIEQACLRDRLT